MKTHGSRGCEGPRASVRFTVAAESRRMKSTRMRNWIIAIGKSARAVQLHPRLFRAHSTKMLQVGCRTDSVMRSAEVFTPKSTARRTRMRISPGSPGIKRYLARENVHHAFNVDEAEIMFQALDRSEEAVELLPGYRALDSAKKVGSQRTEGQGKLERPAC